MKPGAIHSVFLDMEEWKKFSAVKSRRRIAKNSDVSRFMVEFAFRFAPPLGQPLTLDNLVKAWQEMNSDGTLKISESEMHNMVAEVRKEHEAQIEKAKTNATKFQQVFNPEDMTDDEDELT